MPCKVNYSVVSTHDYGVETFTANSLYEVVQLLKRKDHVYHNKSNRRYVVAVYLRLDLPLRAVLAWFGLYSTMGFIKILISHDVIDIFLVEYSCDSIAS